MKEMMILNELLKKLWNRQLDFDERNEKEREATKQLSKEYDELFNKLANTLDSNQLELFELLLEGRGDRSN